MEILNAETPLRHFERTSTEVEREVEKSFINKIIYSCG